MGREARSLRLDGVRGIIAERMMASLASSAQLTFHRDVDVTELLEARERWKADGRRVSLEDCAIWALARALERYPQLNGVASAEAVELSVHVDVAVAISAGGLLMTPVIREAEALSLPETSAAREDLVGRARSGRIKVSEMKGSTVTISNLGSTGVRYFTPILNGGQLLLLGLGGTEVRLTRGPDGSISERRFLGLSLTADHRVVDGMEACQFLSLFSELLVTSSREF